VQGGQVGLGGGGQVAQHVRVVVGVHELSPSG
jgi:hypothetical protein